MGQLMGMAGQNPMADLAGGGYGMDPNQGYPDPNSYWGGYTNPLDQSEAATLPGAGAAQTPDVTSGAPGGGTQSEQQFGQGGAMSGLQNLLAQFNPISPASAAPAAAPAGGAVTGPSWFQPVQSQNIPAPTQPTAPTPAQPPVQTAGVPGLPGGPSGAAVRSQTPNAPAEQVELSQPMTSPADTRFQTTPAMTQAATETGTGRTVSGPPGLGTGPGTDLATTPANVTPSVATGTATADQTQATAPTADTSGGTTQEPDPVRKAVLDLWHRYFGGNTATANAPPGQPATQQTGPAGTPWKPTVPPQQMPYMDGTSDEQGPLGQTQTAALTPPDQATTPAAPTHVPDPNLLGTRLLPATTPAPQAPAQAPATTAPSQDGYERWNPQTRRWEPGQGPSPYGPGGYGGGMQGMNPLRFLQDFLFGGPQALLMDLLGMSGQAGFGPGGAYAAQGSNETIGNQPWQGRPLMPGYHEGPGGIPEPDRPGQTPVARRPEDQPATEKPQSPPDSGKTDQPIRVPSQTATAGAGGTTQLPTATGPGTMAGTKELLGIPPNAQMGTEDPLTHGIISGRAAPGNRVASIDPNAGAAAATPPGSIMRSIEPIGIGARQRPSGRPTQPNVDRSGFQNEIAANRPSIPGASSLMEQAAWMVRGEVGTRASPEAQRVQLETAFNRAQYRNTSLAHALLPSLRRGDGGYYDGLRGLHNGTYKMSAKPSAADMQRFKTQVWDPVVNGSNSSDVGWGPMTGNASGGLAGRQSMRMLGYKMRGGDTYFREGPFHHRLPVKGTQVAGQAA